MDLFDYLIFGTFALIVGYVVWVWYLNLPDSNRRQPEKSAASDATVEDEPKERTQTRAPRSGGGDATPGVQRIVEHTIERQVVVTRCKFCHQLTPVDLERCKSCGAPKFC